MKICLETSYLV